MTDAVAAAAAAAAAAAGASAVVAGSVRREHSGQQPFWGRVCSGEKRHFPWAPAPWRVLRGLVPQDGD